MKQREDWRDHLSPSAGQLSGIRFETSLLYPLMAVAIIVAAAGLVICLATFGLLCGSITADALLIEA